MRRRTRPAWFGKPRPIALSIAAGYLVVSILWILFSDRAISLLTDNPDVLTAAQSLKGLAFVTATAVLLYLLILMGLATSRLREEETAESEARYRSLAEVSPDGIIIHSEGKVLFANMAAARDLGYASADELLGKPVLDLVHPSFRDLVTGRIRSLMEMGQEAPLIEEKFLRADGSAVDVEVAAAPLQFGGRPAVQAVIRNITGRKRAEHLQSAIYRISESANSACSQQELFRSIHDVLGELLPSKNFYIALCDRQAGILSFPYFVDQHDEHPAPGPPGRGITAFVLRSGTPLLATPERFRELLDAGEIDALGADSIDWMGVPLRVREETIGVLAVQTYDERARLTPADLDILAFVSTQVAMAIDRKRSEEALRESEHRFRTLAETTSAAILICLGDRILYANPATSRITGYDVNEFSAMKILDSVSPEFQPLVRESALKLQRKETVSLPLEIQLVRKDGGLRWVELTSGSVQFEGRECLLVTAFDVTQRKSAERELRESENRFRTLADTTTAAIVIYQGEDIRWANAATSAISGFPHGEILRMKFWELVHPDYRQVVKERGLARQEGSRILPSRYEFKANTRSGEERWVEFSAALIPFEGRLAGLGTAFDVTERKRAAERLDHLAHHDLLTGLPNRLMLYEMLRTAVAGAHDRGERLAVLLINIDRFKEVNDSLGHDVGDLVLQALARRLKSRMREGDSLARMGSDEFMVLLKAPASAADPSRVARDMLEAVGAPLGLAGHEFNLAASVGISVFPEDGEDVETLMKNAEIATRRAKGEGGNAFHFITSDLSASASQRVTLKSGLRRALDRGEFTLHFQPQKDLPSDRVTGAEALVRWNHPKFGLLLPDRFISLAEETMTIDALGEWVLRRACDQLREWQGAGFVALDMAVNLSARQFQQRDLTEVIARVLGESGLHPGRLVLEITESTAMWDMENTVQMLKRLNDLGVRIAIDDFGRGYSSLTYLKKFPIHIIKVDQSFVRDVATDPDDAAIVRAVIAMAHGLKLTVIAEGVETAEQMEFLRSAGCDAVQGYFISRASTAVLLEPMLRARSAD